jgi:hypothetical protein
MSAEYFDSIEFDGLLDNFFSNSSEGSTSNDDFDDSSSQASSSKSVVEFKNSKKSTTIKKEKPYNYVPKLARVLRSDVRRTYPEMFVNVFNSLDLPLLFGMFETYFRSDFQQKVHLPCRIPQIANTTINGAISVAHYWYTKILLAPDTTMTLKDVIVVHSEDKTQNRIVARISMKGTRLYTVPESFYKMLPELCEENGKRTKELELLKIGSKRHGGKSETDSRKTIIRDIQQKAEELTNTLILNDTPFKIDSEGSLTMYTDENNRVCSTFMEMFPRNMVTEDSIDIKRGHNIMGRYGTAVLA